MTTSTPIKSTKQTKQKTTRRKGSWLRWLWLPVGLVLLSAFIGWAQTPKPAPRSSIATPASSTPVDIAPGTTKLAPGSANKTRHPSAAP